MRFVKKVISVFLALVFALGMFQLQGITAEASTTINVGSSKNAADAQVMSVNLGLAASVGSTDRSPSKSYKASTPNMITLVDYKGNINVVYAANNVVYIDKYSKTGEYLERRSLEQVLSIFGNITCDDKGNYYVVTGQADTSKKNIVVVSVAKYDYNGSFVKKCDLKSFDTSIYTNGSEGDYWGTQDPFSGGNCQIAYNDGYLCVNYARTMFSGHQSNGIIYIDTSTMTRKRGSGYTDPYMSHSFDQRVLALNDGNFLLAGQGDAFYRGFGIDKVNTADKFSFLSGYTFHFREGTDRDYGYNETFAQLGGIAETDKSYVICGSSERTLSSDDAPSSSYMYHNEARDLFVQFIKKNFVGTEDGSAMPQSDFYVKGETRSRVGNYKSREKRISKTVNVVQNYGVNWLTELDDDRYVAHPKIVTLDNGNILIMWEERDYSVSYGTTASDNCMTYYAVLDANGGVVISTTRLPGVLLTADQDPVVKNNVVYWATNDSFGSRLNMLKIRIADKKAVESFVTRLFNICLNRTPDAAGLEDWTGRLMRNEMTGSQVAYGFVFSPEFKENNYCDSCFVEYMYKAFFNRDANADPEGKKTWVELLANGGKREEVFNGFVMSEEFEKLCNSYGIELGNPIEVPAKGTVPKGSCASCGNTNAPSQEVIEKINGFVTRLYEICLDRTPDADGLASWCNSLVYHDLSGSEVAYGFVFSPEFKDKNLSDEDFVEYMYKAFFNRASDPDGKNTWLTLLASGEYDREGVFGGFTGSTEFNNLCNSYGITRE